MEIALLTIAILAVAFFSFGIGLYYGGAPMKHAATPKQYGLDYIPDWTADEARAFRKFVDSELGETFLRRAKGLERANALAGCQESMNIAHAAGKAAGFSDCLKWIESLGSDETLQKLSGDTADQVPNYPGEAFAQSEEASPDVQRSF